MSNAANILVKVDCNESIMAVRTYSRIRGHRGRFLIYADTVWDALWNENIHYDSDCGHMVTIRNRGDNLYFDVFWLSYYVGDTVDGFVQKFALPKRDLAEILAEGGSRVFLCEHKTSRQAKIVTTYAGCTLRNILSDSRKRRAFSKAMRDCFQWPEETVYLRSDGRNDFYFTTESGYPRNGGLILHENSNCRHPSFCYSVHT